LATKRKKPSGSPVPKSAREILALKVHKRLAEGVLLTRDLQDHIDPMGERLITLEQWRYLRGSIVSDLALYAQLAGKPSPIDIIVKSEQERALIDF
jgi:hypothetical protein